MKLSKIILFFLILGCSSRADEINNSENFEYKITKVFEYEGIIWSIEFINNSDIIFSDKKGKIFIYQNSELIQVDDVPEVYYRGQGGLMDIELHPNFKSNKSIYLSYSKKVDENGGNTAIAKARLDNNKLVNINDIFVGKEKSEKGYHWGSRIQFDNDGKIFFAIGDRGERDVNPQDLTKDGGKVFRINDDGSIPSDNPYVNSQTINPAIYSYGHRNPQGIFLHPQTNDIWTNEHGPKGGDEVNLNFINKEDVNVSNFGWPIASYGIEYDGSDPYKKSHSENGFIEPFKNFTPSIGISEISFLPKEKFLDQNYLFISSLRAASIYLLKINEDFSKILDEDRIFFSDQRIRDIEYDEELNVIFLIFEVTPSIGVLSLY